jgi:hypothetical protein
VVKHGGTHVKLASAGGRPADICRGTLSLTIRKRIVKRVHHRRRVTFKTFVLARVSYRLPTGKQESVAVTLSPVGLRLLGAALHHRLSVHASATLTGGRTARRAVVLQLQLPKRRKR